MLGAMPETGGRGAGSTAEQEPGCVMQECRTSEAAGNWRAVCSETCKHGSEEGRWKRVSNDTSPAAYPTGEPLPGAEDGFLATEDAVSVLDLVNVSVMAGEPTVKGSIGCGLLFQLLR